LESISFSERRIGMRFARNLSLTIPLPLNSQGATLNLEKIHRKLRQPRSSVCLRRKERKPGRNVSICDAVRICFVCRDTHTRGVDAALLAVIDSLRHAEKMRNWKDGSMICILVACCRQEPFPDFHPCFSRIHRSAASLPFISRCSTRLERPDISLTTIIIPALLKIKHVDYRVNI
jgi:hypothetical protein